MEKRYAANVSENWPPQEMFSRYIRECGGSPPSLFRPEPGTCHRRRVEIIASWRRLLQEPSITSSFSVVILVRKEKHYRLMPVHPLSGKVSRWYRHSSTIIEGNHISWKMPADHTQGALQAYNACANMMRAPP